MAEAFFRFSDKRCVYCCCCADISSIYGSYFLEHVVRGFPADPLFYKEERISRNTIFTLYKFNIFNQRIIDSLRKQNKFIYTKKLERDGDTIYVGKILRQIYLDELPQLFNVFMGKMSLVGPRPLNKQLYTIASAIRPHPLAYIAGGMTGNFQSVKDIPGRTSSIIF